MLNRSPNYHALQQSIIRSWPGVFAQLTEIDPGTRADINLLLDTLDLALHEQPTRAIAHPGAVYSRKSNHT
jgi:hypothetical protein